MLAILLFLLAFFIHIQFFHHQLNNQKSKVKIQEIPIELSTTAENLTSSTIISDKTAIDKGQQTSTIEIDKTQTTKSLSTTPSLSIAQESEDYEDLDEDMITTSVKKDTENSFKTHKNYEMFANIPKIFEMSRTRVQHGNLTEIGEFPWVAAFFSVHKNNLSASPLCSCAGSLIAENYIISAAHCFWSEKSDFKM